MPELPEDVLDDICNDAVFVHPSPRLASSSTLQKDLSSFASSYELPPSKPGPFVRSNSIAVLGLETSSQDVEFEPFHQGLLHHAEQIGEFAFRHSECCVYLSRSFEPRPLPSSLKRLEIHPNLFFPSLSSCLAIWLSELKSLEVPVMQKISLWSDEGLDDLTLSSRLAGVNLCHLRIGSAATAPRYPGYEHFEGKIFTLFRACPRLVVFQLNAALRACPVLLDNLASGLKVLRSHILIAKELHRCP